MRFTLNWSFILVRFSVLLLSLAPITNRILLVSGRRWKQRGCGRSEVHGGWHLRENQRGIQFHPATVPLVSLRRRLRSRRRRLRLCLRSLASSSPTLFLLHLFPTSSSSSSLQPYSHPFAPRKPFSSLLESSCLLTPTFLILRHSFRFLLTFQGFSLSRTRFFSFFAFSLSVSLFPYSSSLPNASACCVSNGSHPRTFFATTVFTSFPYFACTTTTSSATAANSFFSLFHLSHRVLSFSLCFSLSLVSLYCSKQLGSPLLLGSKGTIALETSATRFEFECSVFSRG